MPTPERLEAELAAMAVLVTHQRYDITGCVCGWSELGKSHPGHQVAMLLGAGLTLTLAPEGADTKETSTDA